MQEVEELKIKNAELQNKLENRRLETISYLISLINILVILTPWGGKYFCSKERRCAHGTAY